MHQFKTVVFDLDGTLLDTSKGILTSVDYAIEKAGLRPLDIDEKRSFIGPPIQKSFARVYGLNTEKANEVAAIFRNYYKDFELLNATPYDGIFELFESLAATGITPAVATYKREDYAKRLLIHFGFNKYTDILLGADLEGRLTKRDIIENALKMANNTDLSSAVMIGDSENDAIGAKEMNIKFIGVTYGFGFKTEADVNKLPNIGTADNVYQLKKLLLEGD